MDRPSQKQPVVSAIIWWDCLAVLTGGDYARPVFKRPASTLVAGLVCALASLPGPALAEPAPAAAEESAFTERLKALMKQPGRLVTVRLGQDRTPEAPSGPTNIAKLRSGIYTPPLLAPEDMMHVIHERMPDIKGCYQKQLKKDPEWADHLILDLAIRRTGRVSEVSVAPGRVRRDVIGRCLIRKVSHWRFPEFTGETDDGITQEVITASFPFSFAASPDTRSPDRPSDP